MKIKKATLIDFLLLVVIKILLEISYTFYVGKLYGYYGFVSSLSIYKLVESYLAFIVVFMFLPKSEKNVSSIVMRFLFLVMIIPMQSFYALADEARAFFYLFNISFLLTIIVCALMPKCSIKKIKHSNRLLIFVLVVLSLVTYILLIRSNGLPSLLAFNLSKVYQIRSSIIYNPRILMYFVFWQVKVINPFLIGIFFTKKQYKRLLLVMFMQLFIFLLTGHKSILFSPILVLTVIHVIKKEKIMLTLVSKLLILGIGVSLIVFLMNISEWPANLLIRRVLFVPALNYFHYYDFFSHNEYLYLAEGQIGKLFSLTSPYSIPIVNLIGKIYYNNVNTSANTGYLGDAYANFGWYGMLIYSVVLGLLLKVFDTFASKSELTIAVAVIIIPMFSLIESALLTTILSNGLIMSMIFIYLYKNKDVGFNS